MDASSHLGGGGLVSAVVVVAVLVRFGFRELRERKVRLGQMFLIPGIAAAIAVVLVVLAAGVPGQNATRLAIATVVAVAIGAVAGYGSAHFTTLRLTDEPGTVWTKGSVATLAIWVGALALRLLGRFVGGHDVAGSTAANAAVFALLATLLAVVRYRILVKAKLARERHLAGPIAAA